MVTNYDDFLKKYRFKIHDIKKENGEHPISTVFEKKLQNLSQEQNFITLDFEKRYGNCLK